MTLLKCPEPGVPYEKWQAAPGANYLIFDQQRDAATGFGIRVGKRASVFLIEKKDGDKKLKIHVGLARERKGDQKPIDLATARSKAFELVGVAKKHLANPKNVSDRIEASELTLGQVWDANLAHLKGSSEPIKRNSELSLSKARDKLGDWEDRKVRLITAAEIIERFDHHAVDQGHRTAAQSMGRWATAAVNNPIETEVHDAHAEGRAPSLTYNPFTILITKENYRNGKQLERDYAKQGIRNPLKFSESVGPFVDKKVARVNDAKNRGDHEFPIGPGTRRSSGPTSPIAWPRSKS